MPTVKELLDLGKEAEARALLEEVYQQRPSAERSTYASDLLSFSVYLLKLGKVQEAHDLLSRSPVETLELAINLVATVKQLNKPAGDLIHAQQWVLRFAHDNLDLAEPIVRELFVNALNKKIASIAAQCGAILFPKNKYKAPFCMMYAEACASSKRTAEAIEVYKWMIAEFPDKAADGTFHSRLAGCYKETGQLARSLEAQRECVKYSGSTAMQSNYIMMMQYTHGFGMRAFYKECDRLEDLYGYRIHEYTHPLETYQKDPTEGLRIAFLSGDYIDHSLTNLLLPIFKQFKSLGSKHRFYALYTREKDEGYPSTMTYRESVDEFEHVGALSHEALARKIYEDKIDVLIDLSGHTAHNRLPAFLHFPAPLQMGWVSGMMTPVGLHAVPHFITDPGFVPSNPDTPIRERVWAVSSPYAYEPLANSPSVKAELPMQRSGYVTFGSFNNPCKLNDNVLTAWAGILSDVPESRLACKVVDVSHGSYIESFFSKAGIAANRLNLISTHFPRTDDLMSYYTTNIDIALDTWPCAGMLTSLEAMWMGCPVPAFQGDTFLHNQTVSVLKQLELPQLIGTSAKEYRDIVVRLAHDRETLRHLRGDLRERIKSAPLYDPARIAKEIVEVIESAWVFEREHLAKLVL